MANCAIYRRVLSFDGLRQAVGRVNSAIIYNNSF